MAILLNDDKLQDPNAQNQNENQNQNAPGSQAPLVGGDSATVNQGANAAGTGAAGVGPGGTGKWTNIQAYLNANKGVDTGATSMVNEKVGSQFDKERSDLESKSQDVTNQAKQQADYMDEVQKNKDAWLDQAANAYQWRSPGKGDTNPGRVGDTYQKPTPSPFNPNDYWDNTAKINNALSSQYTAPNSFDYSFGNDTQKYGSTLGSDEAFNQFLGDLYQDKAGGNLSSGQRALQTQLNISNEPLAQIRQSLLKKYADMGDLRNKVVSDTSKSLRDYENSFRTNQNNLKDYLNTQLRDTDSAVGAREADAKEEFQRWYNGQFGGANAHLLSSQDPAVQAMVNAQLATQDRKYQPTADAEKRRFNTIARILGVNDGLKSEGFKVRG